MPRAAIFAPSRAAEFKADTVKLVLQEGKSIPQVARDLDLTESSVRQWVKQAEIDSGKGPAGALTTAEKEELARLRKENRELRMAFTEGPSPAQWVESLP